MTPDNKQIGANGCKFIDGTERHSEEFYMIIPQEDTVFNILQENSKDAKVSSSTNVGTTIIKQGAILTPLAGGTFNSLELTSGSVIAYRK